jgi:hypothetical protein
MIKKAADIDIHTKQGLHDLKEKAVYYGHYAEQLKVLELIEEIERLRDHDCHETIEELEAISWTSSKIVSCQLG